MFKENKAFWLYIVGIIVMFFILFYSIKSVTEDNDYGIGKANESGTTSENSEEYVYDEVPENTLDTSKDYFAIIKTNMGEFKIDLYEKSAPNTVNNYIFLATQDFYNGTTFHRIVPDVLLQGGSRNTLNDDQDDDKYGGPGYTFGDEINWDSLDYSEQLRKELIGEGYTSAVEIASKDIEKYRFAMANAGPNTNGSQFFIVLGGIDDNPKVEGLRGRHTVFAGVVEGQDVIDKIIEESVDEEGVDTSRPSKEIKIESIEVYVEG